MADETQDIFGKIDAILGKRAGFATGQPAREEEYPLLTEVVSAPEVTPVPPAGPTQAPRQALGPLPAEAAGAATATAAGLTSTELDRLAAALEARLAELLIRQQLRIETLVRQVVREELAKHSARRD